MTDSSRSRIPLGESSFLRLRRRGMTYVDKTDLVHSLVMTTDKAFLSRPRRFGKSLLVSLLATLFGKGVDDPAFDGLKIRGLWQEKQTYKVASLSFAPCSSYQSIQKFELKFSQLITQGFEPCGFASQESDLLPLLGAWGKWLRNQPDDSLVLLIDEYDRPLSEHLHDPETFNDIRAYLSDFYLTVKDNQDKFHFIFITGIAKFSKANLFSGFNNLLDISLVPRFGTLLGLTEQELRESFARELELAAKMRRPDEADAEKRLSLLISDMTRMYDGFCFDKQAITRVFCPWSVMSFLSVPDNGLANYWIDSGGSPSLLRSYLQTHALKSPEQFDEPQILQEAALASCIEGNDINELALLTQTGYLTIKEHKGAYFVLGYPNDEVRRTMAALYVNRALQAENLKNAVTESDLPAICVAGDAEAFCKTVNRFFLNMDYAFANAIDKEAHCAGFVHMIALVQGLDCRIETHNAFGRSDLEFDAGGFHWVIECKFAASAEEAPAKAALALAQIKARHYGEQHAVSGRRLLRLAMVYVKPERRFVMQFEDDAPSA